MIVSRLQIDVIKIKLVFTFLLSSILLSSCGGYWDECYYHLPEGFKKNITIHFGMEEYSKLTKGKDGNYHIEVDTSGQVYTSTEYDEYFDYQGEFFKWEGDDKVYSFQELKKKNIIDNKTSEGTSGHDGWVIFNKYIVIFTNE